MLRTSQITKLNKIGKQYLSTSSNVFTSIGMCTSEWGHNIKYLDSIDLTINNPKNKFTGWFEWSRVYEVRLNIKKEDIRLTKNFKSNDFDELTKEINNFMENPIKI